jgi:acetyltransferase-like isoleucine patch superfamily enzyme
LDRYDSFVPELAASRFKARAWCNRYNTYFPPPEAVELQSHEALAKLRMTWLRELIGATKGDEIFIEPPFNVDYGCNISFGERFYANFGLTILDCGIVKIGDRVMFGPNVSIYAATHETDVQSRRDNIEYAKPVVIGDDCWIGGQVVILPGVTIGKGCTIAAGAVVSRDIPSWSVAMGQPAKVVKTVKPVD